MRRRMSVRKQLHVAICVVPWVLCLWIASNALLPRSRGEEALPAVPLPATRALAASAPEPAAVLAAVKPPSETAAAVLARGASAQQLAALADYAATRGLPSMYIYADAAEPVADAEGKQLTSGSAYPAGAGSAPRRGVALRPSSQFTAETQRLAFDAVVDLSLALGAPRRDGGDDAGAPAHLRGGPLAPEPSGHVAPLTVSPYALPPLQLASGLSRRQQQGAVPQGQPRMAKAGAPLASRGQCILAVGVDAEVDLPRLLGLAAAVANDGWRLVLVKGAVADSGSSTGSVDQAPFEVPPNVDLRDAAAVDAPTMWSLAVSCAFVLVPPVGAGHAGAAAAAAVPLALSTQTPLIMPAHVAAAYDLHGLRVDGTGTVGASSSSANACASRRQAVSDLDAPSSQQLCRAAHEARCSGASPPGLLYDKLPVDVAPALLRHLVDGGLHAYDRRLLPAVDAARTSAACDRNAALDRLLMWQPDSADVAAVREAPGAAPPHSSLQLSDADGVTATVRGLVPLDTDDEDVHAYFSR